MKYLFLTLVLFISGGAYIRNEQPKIWNDWLAAMKVPDDASSTPPVISQTLTPSTVPSTNTTADAQTTNQPTGVIPVSNPPPQVSEVISPNSTNFINPDHVRPVDQPSQTTLNTVANVPKEFVPPDPIPEQANWNWTVNGRDYHNVVITQVEADRVHITYDGGLGTVNTSDLTPDIQKMLNYDPQTAKLASQQRAAEQAQTDAEQAPLIAAEMKKEKAQADADEAQREAAIQNENKNLAAGVAQDQIQHIQQDMKDMEEAHEVTVSVSYGGNPPSQVVNYSGSTYWLNRYYADQAAIARLQSQAH